MDNPKRPRGTRAQTSSLNNPSLPLRHEDEIIGNLCISSICWDFSYSEIFFLYIWWFSFENKKNYTTIMSCGHNSPQSLDPKLFLYFFIIETKFENEVINLKWCIYCIYGVLSGSIWQYSRLNLGFFRPRSKNALGQPSVPSGLRPSGTACCPREIFDHRRKKPLCLGYTVT